MKAAIQHKLNSIALEKDLLAANYDLWERKLKTKEGDQTPTIPIILEFIHEELERCKLLAEDLPPKQQASTETLDELFRTFL